MRVIKFRVVCKDTKKVIGHEEFNTCLNDGYLYTLESEKGKDQVCHSNYSAKPMPLPTSPFSQLTRLEFTGLKDKNGVDIYEGDCLRHLCNDGTFVKFNGNSFDLFYLRDGAYCDVMDLFNEKLEVIGNIYENPELLK